jgi:signal peptidase I
MMKSNTGKTPLPIATVTHEVEVSGPCMGYLIENGETVFVRKSNPGNYFIGDIIVFRQDGQNFVHRIIFSYRSRGKAHFITRGDIRESLDKPVSETQVIGKVIFVCGRYGAIDITSIEGRLLSWSFGAFSAMRALLKPVSVAARSRREALILWMGSLLHGISGLRAVKGLSFQASKDFNAASGLMYGILLSLRRERTKRLAACLKGLFARYELDK